MIPATQRSGALNNMFGQQDDETPEVIAAEQAGSISAPSPKGGGSPLSQQHEGDGADSSGAVANAGDVGGGRQGGDAPDMLKDKGTVDQYLTQKIMNDKEGRYVTIMEESLNALKKLDPVDVRYAYDKSGMDGEGTLKETETLVNNAVDAGVTTGQMSEEEGEKRKFAFKNIFNVISREEMPLFLIDFGMRAMMAGETMGDLGALGAAGSGAMGALQGRRKEAYDRQVAEGQRRREDHKTSHDITMDRIEAEQKERELDIDEAGEGGVKWQSQYLENFYRDLGYSEAEIGRILAGGPDNTELINENIKRISASVEKIKAAENEFTASAGQRKMATIPDESGKLIQKPYADLTEEDIVRAAQWTAEQSIKRAGALRESERREQTLNRVRKESGIGS